MSDIQTQIPSSPLITKVMWQRKLKAFVTIVLTAFILGTLAFPLVIENSKSESTFASDPLLEIGTEVSAKLSKLTELNESQNSKLQQTEQALIKLGNKIRHASQPDLSYEVQANALFESAISNQTVGNAKEIAELNQRLDTLVQQREHAIQSSGMEHATTRFIQSEIEKVRLEIAFLDDPWNRGDMNLTKPPSTHQQMAFFDEAGVAEILEPAFDTFTQLKKDMESENATIAEVVSIFSNLAPVVTQSDEITARPKSMPRLIWIGLFSIVAGAGVVWRLNPLHGDTGFENDAEIEEVLGVPVIATLTSESPKDTEELKTPLANFVVDMSEYILLALATILVISMVVSPVLRETFFNNPLTGISEVFWSIVG